MYVSVESYDRILEKEVFFWYGFGPLWMDVFSAFQWPLCQDTGPSYDHPHSIQ